MLLNNQTRSELWRLIYKLLHDAIFLLILVLGCFLLVEGIAPGLFTPLVSFSKIAILLSILILATGLLTPYVAPATPLAQQKTRLIWALGAFAIILVANSLFSFKLWENVIITLLTIAIAFFLSKSLEEK
ncbi:hypothetical protein EPO05_00605 [Patescibacteria group bacterium]|nr:MAG: hypothetical protein EPO05_00605 [Patescibacteria group bacterium]